MLVLMLGVLCGVIAISIVGPVQSIIPSVHSNAFFQWLLKNTGLEKQFAGAGCPLAVSRSK